MPVLRELSDMRAIRRRLAEIVRAEKPHLLHAHSPVLNAIPAISVARRFGLPVVYEVRALWEDAAVDLGHTREGSPRYLASRWLETYALRRADWVIALCDPLRAELIGRGLAPERVSVVPNAVEADFLEAATENPTALKASLGLADQFVLGFIGSFYAYEGLDVLLRAIPLLAARLDKFTVLLVGGGPDEARLRTLAEELGLSRWVKFVGRVKLEEVGRYYGVMDMMVYPRRRMRLTELTTPLKPLEAMAQGKLVVATDVGGHRELVRHDETGFLCAADDPAALAGALFEALDDADRRARIARNGRSFVAAGRTWDANGDRYASIYDRLLRQGAAARC